MADTDETPNTEPRKITVTKKRSKRTARGMPKRTVKRQAPKKDDPQEEEPDAPDADAKGIEADANVKDPKRRRLPLWIALGIVVLLLAVAGGLAYYYFGVYVPRNIAIGLATGRARAVLLQDKINADSARYLDNIRETENEFLEAKEQYEEDKRQFALLICRDVGRSVNAAKEDEVRFRSLLTESKELAQKVAASDVLDPEVPVSQVLGEVKGHLAAMRALYEEGVTLRMTTADHLQHATTRLTDARHQAAATQNTLLEK